MRKAIAILLLLVPGSLSAQETVEPNTITVSGRASVEYEPDQVVIQVAVETFASMAPVATSENSKKMDAVIRALERLGLRRDQIKTIGFRIQPEYDHSGTAPRQAGEDRLVGYRAINTIQITSNDIMQAGPIIQTAIDAGANRVSGVRYQLRDPEAARQEALRLAVVNARGEAEAIAAALGRRLGAALAVTTVGTFSPVRMEAAGRLSAMAMDMPPPLVPGTIEVDAQVTVIYRFEPAQ